MSASFQLLLQVVSTLLLLLLCWQHTWHDVSVHRPSRPGIRPAAGIAEPVAAMPPPASIERPPRWAAASAQPVPLWEANLAEQRLRHVWRATDVHKPGSRHATVEIHNDSWTFLDQRQLRRGSSSPGDPLRMQCMAARLLAGEATKLSTVAARSPGGLRRRTNPRRHDPAPTPPTLTLTRHDVHDQSDKSLFHWKIYQWINATFAGARARAPLWRRSSRCDAVIGGVLIEYAVNLDDNDKEASSRPSSACCASY